MSVYFLDAEVLHRVLTLKTFKFDRWGPRERTMKPMSEDELIKSFQPHDIADTRAYNISNITLIFRHLIT